MSGLFNSLGGNDYGAVLNVICWVKPSSAAIWGKKKTFEKPLIPVDDLKKPKTKQTDKQKTKQNLDYRLVNMQPSPLMNVLKRPLLAQLDLQICTFQNPQPCAWYHGVGNEDEIIFHVPHFNLDKAGNTNHHTVPSKKLQKMQVTMQVHDRLPQTQTSVCETEGLYVSAGGQKHRRRPY